MFFRRVGATPNPPTKHQIDLPNTSHTLTPTAVHAPPNIIIGGPARAKTDTAVVALLYRLHSQLTAFYLSLRSFLHQCRAMFTPCREALQLARLEQALECARSKAVRFNGRSCYRQDLFDELKEGLPKDAKLPQKLCHSVLRNSGAMYQALPLHAQAHYDEVSKQRARSKHMELEKDGLHSEARLDQFRSRWDADRSERGHTNLISDLRIKDSDLEELRVSVLSSSTASKRSLRDALEWEVDSPPMPPEPMLEFFACHAEVDGPVAALLPWQ